MFRFDIEQKNQSGCGHSLGLVHLDDVTLSLSNGEDARLLVMAADSQIHKPTLLSSFHVQFFSNLRKKVPSAYRHLHICVNRKEKLDAAEPSYFNEVLFFRLRNRGTRMCQRLAVLQRYLDALNMFSFNAKGKKRLWKRGNKGWLGRALEGHIRSSFPVQRI